MLSETKVDDSFPKGQFLKKGLVNLLEQKETLMGEEFSFILEKIFRESFCLLKLYQHKAFLMKLI